MNVSRQLHRLLIAGLLGANLVVLSLSGYALLQSRQKNVVQAETATQTIANALEQNVSSSIERIDLALLTVTDELERQLAGKGIDEPAVNAFLKRYEQRLPEVEAFRVANAAGQVVLGRGVNPQQPASWADREYFVHLRDHPTAGLQISKPRIGRVAKQAIIGFARRYNYPDGSFAGVVSAPVAVSHFSKILTLFNIGPKGTLILRDSDLGLIARMPPIADQPAGQLGHSGVSKEFRQLAASGMPASTYHITNSPDGFERILTFRRLEKARMFAIVGTASDDYLAEWQTEVYKTSAIVLGFIALSGLLGTLLLRQIVQSEKDRQRLQENERYLSAIIANEPECIKILDAEGRLLQMNPAGLAMIEADSLEQVFAHPVLEVVAPEDQAAFAEMHRRVMGGAAMHMEFEAIGLKGGRRRLDTHAVPMQYGDQIVHLSVTRDITERKAYENGLKQAKAAAEAASLAKSTFLATMSHEIRTPMNGILGMAQLLQEPKLTEKDRLEYARTVLDSGQTLLRLLNDILDFSKVEAGKLELAYAAFSPDQIVDETVALFVEHAHSKGLQIEADWHGPADRRYLGDAIRVRQMISNLIGNAIKFTAAGEIRLDVKETSCHGNQAVLEFAVTDSGIGIPAERHAQLFRPFSQVDGSSTRAYGGTGLGLSIIRSLAQMMGGEVGLDSEVGKGSRFWFTLRAEVLPSGGDSRQVGHEPAAEAAMPVLATLAGRVLVVEDNPTNRKVIEAMLGKFGLQTDSTADGQEAVDAIILRGLRPDVVLMDVQMPVLDGIKATMAIRRWEVANRQPRMPIIALTAGAFDEDRQQCMAAGMDDFLTKPISLTELGAALGKWLGAMPPPA